MRKYFAYTRVSTQKQGEKGSSLSEQRAAIEAFAQRSNITVTEWFEERETAAKQGRTIFRKMFTALEKGDAHGVIMHKIDRGARNLKDWADLGMLIDRGIEVHFANENLDLHSRGGRLSADIQAVVAADYIRNLREEVKKGLYGRLKQGIYPLCAPMGYCDNGSGKLKTICPKNGHLVRKGFELYATGNYTLQSLRDELAQQGLVSRFGTTPGLTGISHMLNNPFYYGLIYIKRNKQTFQGKHEPIISKSLFDRVQATMRRPIRVKTAEKRSYVLQRMMRCKACNNGLYAETQKGIIYYRCHTRTCHGVSIREDTVLRTIAQAFGDFHIDEAFFKSLVTLFAEVKDELHVAMQNKRKHLELCLSKLKEKEDRLTDAYLERALDRETFDARKKDVLQERASLQETLHNIEKKATHAEREQEFLELLNALKNLAFLKFPAEIRQLLKTAISNLTISGKNVEIKWDFPMSTLQKMQDFQFSAQGRGRSRMFWTREQLKEIAKAVIYGEVMFRVELEYNDDNAEQYPLVPTSEKEI